MSVEEVRDVLGQLEFLLASAHVLPDLRLRVQLVLHSHFFELLLQVFQLISGHQHRLRQLLLDELLDGLELLSFDQALLTVVDDACFEQ